MNDIDRLLLYIKVARMSDLQLENEYYCAYEMVCGLSALSKKEIDLKYVCVRDYEYERKFVSDKADFLWDLCISRGIEFSVCSDCEDCDDDL